MVTTDKVTSKLVISRKSGINSNRIGSVQKSENDTVRVDFIYLGQRVRESAGLKWNQRNAKLVRHQLDKIGLAIKDGSFVFAEVFPKSKKKNFFSKLERQMLGRNMRLEEVDIYSYSSDWYNQLKISGRVQERTLLGYKSHLELYIKPFFEGMNFAQLNPTILEEYTIWARQQEYRNKPASNATINKTLIPLKMICKQAAVKYGWGISYNPFFGFNNLPKESTNHKIEPFTLVEQEKIIKSIPSHWKPYFRFAFCSGIRQGEQFALKPADIDWEKDQVTISKAMTLNERGCRVEGRTKNQYSRRQIQLSPVMKSALLDQKTLSDGLGSKYLFCTTNGHLINHANLSNRVWKPALDREGIPYRPMIQTRHSFATTALSLGENPLWIAHIMGHRDTDMIIRVYTKYVGNAANNTEGNLLNNVHEKVFGNYG